MVYLLNPHIQCTDPDQLQFCLKISDVEFWYCEPNWSNDKLLPESNSDERKLLQRYKGCPQRLLDALNEDSNLRNLLLNPQIWLTGSSEIDDFTEEEKHKLLGSYGYSWDYFEDNVDRNQLICEIYFEENPTDFRNDI